MPVVDCARCGEPDNLSGTRVEGGIEIICNRCGHSWLRETQATCSNCGGRTMRAIKEPLIQRARGTAFSVVGQRTSYLCEVCDAEEIVRRFGSPNVERPPREDPWK